MKGKKNDDFGKILDLIRNVPEISECKYIGICPDSTSLPDVKLVDGLPSARHSTEAVWGARRVFGPAAIYDFDKQMY